VALFVVQAGQSGQLEQAAARSDPGGALATSLKWGRCGL
jgi:hypothetical protein